MMFLNIQYAYKCWQWENKTFLGVSFILQKPMLSLQKAHFFQIILFFHKLNFFSVQQLKITSILSIVFSCIWMYEFSHGNNEQWCWFNTWALWIWYTYPIKRNQSTQVVWYIQSCCPCAAPPTSHLLPIPHRQNNSWELSSIYSESCYVNTAKREIQKDIVSFISTLFNILADQRDELQPALISV